MQGTILIIAIVAVGAGVLAVFVVLVLSFLTGKNPSDDPPRAFISELVGLWIASFFVISSFLVEDSVVVWTLRLLSLFCAVAALYVRATIIHGTALPDRPNTGQASPVEISPEQTTTDQAMLKTDATDLHSEEPSTTTGPL
jgi:hypothetical protein